MIEIHKIKNFFSQYNDSFERESIVLLRGDGIQLYSKITNPALDAQAIGALACGLWQAASALSANSQIKNKEIDYRLSFDTSGSGVYILPVKVQTDELYLCAIYENLINPALFKRNLQLIVQDLEALLKNKLNIKPAAQTRDEFLFDAISDEEMDSLFNF